MLRTRYKNIAAFVTRDGSLIRELMHPAEHNNSQQSLAQATVAVGQKTKLHQHAKTEELYHITAGEGCMTLADETFMVGSGDTVCILPNTPHCIENTGSEDLVILCCCSPAYSHDDTELLSP